MEIAELRARSIELFDLKNSKKKNYYKNEQSLRDLCDNISHFNLYLESQKERKQNRAGEIKNEEIVLKLPNVVKY